MIIVAGTFDVAPERREEFLAGRYDLQLHSRTEPGCVEYAFSADAIDPGRVRVFSIWSDQASLDQHAQAYSRQVEAEQAADPVAFAQAVPMLAQALWAYDLTDAGPRPL